MSLDVARILRILNNNNVNIGLKKAMFIAQTIMDLHSERVCQMENWAFDRGVKAGRREMEKEMEGKTLVSNYELARLRGHEKRGQEKARELVGEVVRTIGSKKKIQCIKELRNQTGLGLKETKDIVDEYVAKLDGMYLMDYQRAEYDASYTHLTF